jgi:hypothetical protein
MISAANKNWDMNIKRKFSKDQVMCFFEEIDREMNGLINLKTFTRELGSLASQSLRKKDVLRIFRRLENGNTISLCSLMR